MNTVTLSTTAASYLAQVEAELSDLPTEDRAELMADLADHLAALDHEAQRERERFAHDDTQPAHLEPAFLDPDHLDNAGVDGAADAGDASWLTQRLGSPARYASELRASAGLPPRTFIEQPPHRGEEPGHVSATEPPGRSERTAAMPALGPWAASLFARSPFGPFREEVRVAWWTVRAVLATMVLAGATGTAELPIPAVFGSHLVGLVTMVAALWASFRLGRRSGTLPGWLRWSLLGGGALVAFIGVALLGASSTSSGDTYVEATPFGGPFPPAVPWYGEDGWPVRNLFVYDRDGNLLRDVLIYDQNGRPVVTYDDGSAGTHVRTVAADANGAPVLNAYPIEERPVRYDTGTPTAGEPLPPPAVVVPRLAADGRRILATDQYGGVQMTLADASTPITATTVTPAPGAAPSSPNDAPTGPASADTGPASTLPSGPAPTTAPTNASAPAATAADSATTTSPP